MGVNSFQTERELPEFESIAALAEKLVYRLPGCDNEMIRRQLQDTYRDFCRLSSCFTLPREMEIEDGERHYPVPSLFPGTYVDSVTEVWLDGRKLFAPRDYVVEIGRTPVICLSHRNVPDGQGDRERELAASGELSDRSHGCDRHLRVTAIEIPKNGSERAPRWFYDKYGDAIVSGALSKLFAMTGKAWSDPAQATTENVRYENFLTEARVRSAYAPDGGSGSGAISALDTSGLL